MNSEPTINQADKLDEALALLAAGLSLDEVLAEAGDDAAWLRPMLALATEVDALKVDIPIPSSQASLDRLLAHANSLATPASSSSPGQTSRSVARPRFNFGRLLFNTGLSTAIAAGLLVLVCVFGSLLGGGMVLAAEGSLPGQPLYPVKRLGETIRLTLTQDTRQRQQLEDTLNQRRIDEVNHLIEQRKTALVRFIGRIEAISATGLMVDDLTIELAPETVLDGELAVGALVRLEGQTNGAGQLVAVTISVLEPAPPMPTPTVTPTPIPPTSTPTPPPTVTPTAAIQSTSDTIKLAPTATPKPAPVEMETDDDGAKSDNSGPGNDDGSDNNSGSSDNSGPGSDGRSDDNSGPGSGSDDNNNVNNDNSSEDNSGSGSNDNLSDNNSGSDSNNNSSDDNSGSGSNNSGSNDNDSDNRDDNSGSGSSNSGSNDRDDNSGKDSGKSDDSGDDD